MSGTEIAYGFTTSRSRSRSTAVRLRYHALSPYTLATRCPVLACPIALRACYVIPGTDTARAAHHATRAASGHDTEAEGTVTSHMVISALCLRACYAMSGTYLAYATYVSAYARAARCPVPYLPTRMLLSPYPYAATRMLLSPYPYAAARMLLSPDPYAATRMLLSPYPYAATRMLLSPYPYAAISLP
eukprot:3447280-Rhodomonas_salina.6